MIPAPSKARQHIMRKVFMTNIILLISLLLLTTFLPSTQAQSQQPLSGYCGDKCKGRCALAGVLDRCMRYCGICCEECKCVPSGTYGNKHECPCYRDKTNSKGKPKCP